MTIGLVGSHRTGKSTLARAYAAHNPEYAVVETSISGVFAKLGLDPKVEYPFAQRLDIQRHILDTLEGQYRQGGLRFIADRTPVCMMAYTLADVQRTTLLGGNVIDVALEKYLADCIEVTNRHFGVLMVVQPGIPTEEAEGKAAVTRGYMEHLNALVMGLCTDDRITCAHFALNRATLDLDKRVRAIDNMLAVSKSRSARQDGILVYH